MILHKFEKIIARACAYYEHRHPKDETMDVWAERVKGIPDAAAEYIETHIADNEQFPKNMPNLMWALYSAWQAVNPDKKATQAFFSCPDCIDGIIWASKQDESGRKYRYIFRCCKCKQNRVQAYPKAYKHELIRNGYEITTPGDVRVSKQETTENLKKLGVTMPLRTAEPVMETPF